MAETKWPPFRRQHFQTHFFSVRISIKISLKFDPKGPNNNIPALVQIMAWRRPGDKPLSEPMMDNLPTHICVTRPHLNELMLTPLTVLWITPEMPWRHWNATIKSNYSDLWNNFIIAYLVNQCGFCVALSMGQTMMQDLKPHVDSKVDLIKLVCT